MWHDSDTDGKNALYLVGSHEITNVLRLFPHCHLYGQRDSRGDTPLFTATRLSNEYAVDYFIQTGDSTLARDFQRNTILHIVCLVYNLIAKIFPLSILLDKEPRRDSPPSHLSRKTTSRLREPSSSWPILNFIDCQDRTPLMLAKKHYHTWRSLSWRSIPPLFSPSTFSL